MNKTIHHFKAYLFFLALSVALVSILVYLYFPVDTSSLQMSTLISSEVEKPTTTSADVSVSPSDTLVAERMKLTALLLRYQKKLAEAESRKETDDIIQALKTKIAQLEKMIQELTR